MYGIGDKANYFVYNLQPKVIKIRKIGDYIKDRIKK